MALLLQTSPPFVNAKCFGNDISTRGEGEKRPFCPGEEPLYAHV